MEFFFSTRMFSKFINSGRQRYGIMFAVMVFDSATALPSSKGADLALTARYRAGTTPLVKDSGVQISLTGLQGHSLSTPGCTARTGVDRSKSVARLQLIRPGLVRIRLIVEPFGRLPPVPPGHHQALQQRRGSEPPLLKLVIHHVSNVISRIKPNEIEQSERPHGISTSQFHSVINILDRSHALFISADGVEQIRHQQPVHN